MNSTYCPHCGKPLVNNPTFCPYCGARVNNISSRNNKLSNSPTGMNSPYKTGNSVFFPKLAPYGQTLMNKIKITLTHAGYSIKHSTHRNLKVTGDFSEIEISLHPRGPDLHINVSSKMHLLSIILVIFGFMFMIIGGIIVLMLINNEVEKDRYNVIEIIYSLYPEVYKEITIPAPAYPKTRPITEQQFMTPSTQIHPIAVESGQEIKTTKRGQFCPYLNLSGALPVCNVTSRTLPYTEADQVCKRPSIWPTCPYYKRST